MRKLFSLFFTGKRAGTSVPRVGATKPSKDRHADVLEKKMCVFSILAHIRATLRGERLKSLPSLERISHNDVIEIISKTQFIGADLVWLQVASEEQVEHILEDIERLYKKYCPNA